jgi:hypothetical protein
VTAAEGSAVLRTTPIGAATVQEACSSGLVHIPAIFIVNGGVDLSA